MTTPRQNLWTRWVDLVSTTESATAQALFRIGVGLGTLLTVGSVVWNGLLPVLWVDAAEGGYRALGDGPWLVALLGGPTLRVMWALAAGALAGGVLLVVGLGGRVGALFTLICTTQVLDVNGHAGGSYDMLLTNALWLAVLSGGEATLSLQARLDTGSWWPIARILAFPRWLALWQLVLMYCTTGLQKLSAYWVPGGDASALYYILQQPEWHRREMSFLAWLFPLTQVATMVTWFWEVLNPLWLLAIWWSVDPTRTGRLPRLAERLRLRWVFAGLGIFMHAMIFVSMDVGPFSFLSLAFYVLVVHPWEWERGLGWRTVFGRNHGERGVTPNG